MAPVTRTRISGTFQTLLSGALNSLANNASVLSGEITLTSAGYPDAKMVLNIAGMSGNPTANTTFNGWFIEKVDGTNYEDGGVSVTPTRVPDFIFPVNPVSTAQVLKAEVVGRVPVGAFKVLLRNAGTGQALASSGNSLGMGPLTDQMA